MRTFNGKCDHCLNVRPRCVNATCTAKFAQEFGVPVPEGQPVVVCEECRKNLRGLIRLKPRKK